jgi:hypothetical protein
MEVAPGGGLIRSSPSGLNDLYQSDYNHPGVAIALLPCNALGLQAPDLLLGCNSMIQVGCG